MPPADLPPLPLAAALGTLVAALTGETANDAATTVREALRRTTAAARDDGLELVLDGDLLRCNGRVLPREAAGPGSALGTLVAALERHGAGTLVVRRGATPAELRELARVLAGDAPAPWHSWSVRVTPEAGVPLVGPETDARGGTGAAAGARWSGADDALRALAEARDIDAVQGLVRELLDMAGRARDDATAAGAARLATITAGLVREGARRGTRAGRLAVEGALRQLLDEAVLARLVEALPGHAAHDELLGALARGGDASVRVLVATMLESEAREVRRCCYDAIVAIGAGDAPLREALEDERWYVARNVVALLGELQIADADALVVPYLAHEDERLRLAAAQALLQLATSVALGALQRRLDDASADVRRLAVAAHVRGRTRPGAQGLIEALERETDAQVALEIVATLGALGTADAVQRLVRVARGEDGVEAWLREAAELALVGARGEQARRLLA